MIETELSGVSEKVVSALLWSPVTYDVQSLNKAFQDQDYDTVETIMLSSRSEILVDIEEEYLTGKRRGPMKRVHSCLQLR